MAETQKPHIVWLLDGGFQQPVREKMPFWADGYSWIWRREDGKVCTNNRFPRWDCPEICRGDNVLGVLFFEGEA